MADDGRVYYVVDSVYHHHIRLHPDRGYVAICREANVSDVNQAVLEDAPDDVRFGIVDFKDLLERLEDAPVSVRDLPGDVDELIVKYELILEQIYERRIAGDNTWRGVLYKMLCELNGDYF